MLEQRPRLRLLLNQSVFVQTEEVLIKSRSPMAPIDIDKSPLNLTTTSITKRVWTDIIKLTNQTFTTNLKIRTLEPHLMDKLLLKKLEEPHWQKNCMTEELEQVSKIEETSKTYFPALRELPYLWTILQRNNCENALRYLLTQTI